MLYDLGEASRTHLCSVRNMFTTKKNTLCFCDRKRALPGLNPTGMYQLTWLADQVLFCGPRFDSLYSQSFGAPDPETMMPGLRGLAGSKSILFLDRGSPCYRPFDDFQGACARGGRGTTMAMDTTGCGLDIHLYASWSEGLYMNRDRNVVLPHEDVLLRL